MTTRLISLLAMAGLAAAGCSAAQSDEPVEAGDLAEQTECTTLTKEPTEELYVREMFTCGADATVYTFNNSDGKTGWLDIAETFGAVVLDEGDLWLKVED